MSFHWAMALIPLAVIATAATYRDRSPKHLSRDALKALRCHERHARALRALMKRKT